MKRLYLVDVSSMFFRAFYAIRPLSNQAGMPTNAIYGFVSMTVKLLREIKPDYMVFCFDRPEPSFRKGLDPRYKANRTEMPEDLVPQVPYIRRVSEAMGVPCMDRQGFEADDLIGTLTSWGRERDMEVVIVSGDKDFGQLVRPHVTIYDTMKDIRYDSAGVVEKWGIEPRKMRDYLALVGDSSDNVPGVRGIGPKGACKLLAEFDSLEDIYKNLDKIDSASLRKKLEEGRDEAFLSQKLVTIVENIDFDIRPEDLRLKPIERESLHTLLMDLDFKSFAKTLLGDTLTSPRRETEEPASAGTVGWEPALAEMEKATPSMGTAIVSSAIGSSAIGSSFVRPASDAMRAQVAATLGRSDNTTTLERSPDGRAEGLDGTGNVSRLEFQPGVFELPRIEEKRLTLAQVDRWLKPGSETWGFHTERGILLAQENVVAEIEGAWDELGSLLSEKKLAWKGFDLKEFWKAVNLRSPVETAGSASVLWDQMLAAYVARAGAIQDVRALFTLYNGVALPELPSPGQLFGAHLRLEKNLLRKLESVHGLAVLREIELPLVPVLYAMERSGVRIDLGALEVQSADLGQDIAAFEKAIHREAGEAFNIGSPKQLGHVLFEKLKMPAGKRTKTGYSTDEETLAKLASEFPICAKILQYRELSKLKNTYVDALPILVNKTTGRVHTTFNQANTTTGRLSSTNPNLQNIPIRTERGARIRKAFVADEGQCLISADYSQIELRILAHVTS
ncbi:MAG: DNA polymerase I, partial [Bdellovibrionaceae bacterium]|nr:DNA polymerase I [Pseudobdellovibrionaceae bacterium]